MRIPHVIMVDDFLQDPDAIRAVALAQPFVKMHSAGVRTEQRFLHLAPYREEFQRLLGSSLTNWDDNAANGRFQCCFATDAIPYHSDSQSRAGVLFLTPKKLAEVSRELGIDGMRRAGRMSPTGSPLPRLARAVGVTALDSAMGD